MSRKSVFPLITILLFMQHAFPVSFASAGEIIAELHKAPPAPCVSKATDDMSSGMRIYPDGIAREDVRNVMAWIASKFVTSGGQYLNSKNIDKVYTAVFYESKPVNEIGIYGYRFITPIQPDDFKAIPEFNGKLFVLHGELLIFLWHEEISRTKRCFSAIEKILELHVKD